MGREVLTSPFQPEGSSSELSWVPVNVADEIRGIFKEDYPDYLAGCGPEVEETIVGFAASLAAAPEILAFGRNMDLLISPELLEVYAEERATLPRPERGTGEPRVSEVIAGLVTEYEYRRMPLDRQDPDLNYHLVQDSLELSVAGALERSLQPKNNHLMKRPSPDPEYRTMEQTVQARDKEVKASLTSAKKSLITWVENTLDKLGLQAEEVGPRMIREDMAALADRPKLMERSRQAQVEQVIMDVAKEFAPHLQTESSAPVADMIAGDLKQSVEARLAGLMAEGMSPEDIAQQAFALAVRAKQNGEIEDSGIGASRIGNPRIAAGLLLLIGTTALLAGCGPEQPVTPTVGPENTVTVSEDTSEPGDGGEGDAGESTEVPVTPEPGASPTSPVERPTAIPGVPTEAAPVSTYPDVAQVLASEAVNERTSLVSESGNSDLDSSLDEMEAHAHAHGVPPSAHVMVGEFSSGRDYRAFGLMVEGNTVYYPYLSNEAGSIMVARGDLLGAKNEGINLEQVGYLPIHGPEGTTPQMIRQGDFVVIVFVDQNGQVVAGIQGNLGINPDAQNPVLVFATTTVAEATVPPVSPTETPGGIAVDAGVEITVDAEALLVVAPEAVRVGAFDLNDHEAYPGNVDIPPYTVAYDADGRIVARYSEAQEAWLPNRGLPENPNVVDFALVRSQQIIDVPSGTAGPGVQIYYEAETTGPTMTVSELEVTYNKTMEEIQAYMLNYYWRASQDDDNVGMWGEMSYEEFSGRYQRIVTGQEEAPGPLMVFAQDARDPSGTWALQPLTLGAAGDNTFIGLVSSRRLVDAGMSFAGINAKYAEGSSQARSNRFSLLVDSQNPGKVYVVTYVPAYEETGSDSRGRYHPTSIPGWEVFLPLRLMVVGDEVPVNEAMSRGGVPMLEDFVGGTEDVFPFYYWVVDGLSYQYIDVYPMSE